MLKNFLKEFLTLSFNKTALHTAAENNHILVVRSLLFNEVIDVNAKTHDGIY